MRNHDLSLIIPTDKYTLLIVYGYYISINNFADNGIFLRYPDRLIQATIALLQVNRLLFGNLSYLTLLRRWLAFTRASVLNHFIFTEPQLFFSNLATREATL